MIPERSSLFAPAFQKSFAKKPPKMQAAIAECIKKVCTDPTNPGLRLKRVQGCAGVFEARVDRANRVTLHFDGPTVVFRNHCNHDVISRNP